MRLDIDEEAGGPGIPGATAVAIGIRAHIIYLHVDLPGPLLESQGLEPVLGEVLLVDGGGIVPVSLLLKKNGTAIRVGGALDEKISELIGEMNGIQR